MVIAPSDRRARRKVTRTPTNAPVEFLTGPIMATYVAVTPLTIDGAITALSAPPRTKIVASDDGAQAPSLGACLVEATASAQPGVTSFPPAWG